MMTILVMPFIFNILPIQAMLKLPQWIHLKLILLSGQMQNHFFRVRGFDFSTVIANIAIQGEYGEMLKDNNLLLFGRSPSAMVLSAYAQFENFNILTLYRNYDLKYDNPYQRFIF